MIPKSWTPQDLSLLRDWIDTHVHFRDRGFTYKEDLHTGALAAAKGGFTSVICMANTSPVVDSLPVLKDRLTARKMKTSVSSGGCHLLLSEREKKLSTWRL